MFFTLFRKGFSSFSIFGLLALFLITVVPAQAQSGGPPLALPLIANWQASYWNNTTFSGPAVLSRQENNIDYRWGMNAPGPGVGVDYFSARWTSTVFVPATGQYAFVATNDDGLRLWVDNVLVLDNWLNGSGKDHTLAAERHLTKGNHDLKVEYYDVEGNATAVVSWHPIVVNWRGEYFNNKNLSGAPIMVRDDAQINFNWGAGSPEPALLAVDQFSARWTRTVNLAAGRYEFSVTGDDGVRLWVNNNLVINKWIDQVSTTYKAEVTVSGGSVPIKMEYYDNSDNAVARLSWRLITPPPPPPTNNSWQGEYFNNATLSGTPVLLRNDAQINFGWGTGSPGSPVNADNFSVRWNRTLNLEAGRYKFTATADDGVRVWVNNNLVIDRWRDQPATTFNAEVTISNTAVPVRIEYYDKTGSAEMRFSWSRVDVPSGNPTATVNTAYLNMRSGPGVQYNVVATLSRGNVVQMTYRNSAATWVKLIAPSGAQGWVNVSYLSTTYQISNLPVATGN